MKQPRRRREKCKSGALFGKPKRMLIAFSIGLLLGVAGLAGFLQHRAEARWTMGQLRDDGLRIIPSGLSDNSAVLDPRQFHRREVRRAYAIAYEIPGVLNQLNCWCGCENRGVHRSSLACFEDEMSVNCAVCRGTAEIAMKWPEMASPTSERFRPPSTRSGHRTICRTSARPGQVGTRISWATVSEIKPRSKSQGMHRQRVRKRRN